MTNYAYLRVSTDSQDVENQKSGILHYCNDKSLGNVQYISDTASSKLNWKDREIGELINETASEGDTVIISEISRAARSTLEVLEFAQVALDRGINVHIAKQNIVFDDSLATEIQITVLALAAKIERSFIQSRTKEALNHRQQQIDENGYFISKAGNKVEALGRPKGKAKHHKLDAHRDDINKYLEMELSKRAIAKLIDCSPSTLYDWCKRNKK